MPSQALESGATIAGKAFGAASLGRVRVQTKTPFARSCATHCMARPSKTSLSLKSSTSTCALRRVCQFHVGLCAPWQTELMEVLIAKPAMMPALAKLGKILGPRLPVSICEFMSTLHAGEEADAFTEVWNPRQKHG